MIVGGFLSTLLPVIGPALVHPPMVLHTRRLSVAALAVSVPIGTFVIKLKLASTAFFSPNLASLAVHAMMASPLRQVPSDVPHDTCGGGASPRAIAMGLTKPSVVGMRSSTLVPSRFARWIFPAPSPVHPDQNKLPPTGSSAIPLGKNVPVRMRSWGPVPSTLARCTL